MAAWFRIIYTVIYAIVLLFLFMVLPQINGFVEHNDLNSLSVFCLKAFDTTWLIGFIFFGFHLCVLGYLAIKSKIILKLISWIVVLSGIAYLFESYANILLPNYDKLAPIVQNIVTLSEFLGELLLILWMLIRGAKIFRTT